MSDLMQDLMEFMESEEAKQLDIQIGNEKEPFVIKSMDQANYFVKRIAALNEEKARIKETVKAELERTKQRLAVWEEKQVNSLDNSIEYFTKLLEEFAKDNLPKGKKSISLPNGTLQFKKQLPAYKYDDEMIISALRQIGQEHFIMQSPVTYSVDKTALKKESQIIDGHLVLNGQVIEGVTIEERPQLFVVK